MTIYFILIGYILFSPLIIRSFVRDRDTLKKKVLLFSLIGIFLVLALKAPSVGRDTLGYRIMYERLSQASWDNFYNYYWTETGYEVVEMLFSHFLRVDYQVFSASVYAFIILSYYKFLDRYADDITLSLIIYVCFGYIVFDISGLRFALSLAIFLFALPYAQKRELKNALVYFVIVLIAAQVHRGAYICLFLYFVIRFPFKGWAIVAYVSFPVIMFLFKPILNAYLATFSNAQIESGLSIGGNVIFYCFVLLLIISLNKLWKNSVKNSASRPKKDNIFEYKNIGTQTRLFYIGTVMVATLGEGTVVRTAQYGLFTLIPLLPNAISMLNGKSRLLMKCGLFLFLISYFIIFKILPNDLDIGPYVFFWNY